ncbi:MAG: hypothetical protein FWC00_01215 [Firmicutes bacterium]|nr:hypothetical protein [Bacillota bacterium]
MKKQICILTKSLKDRDYCVAGIDLQTKQWIRLVSSKDGGAIPKELLDDRNINVLDVIEIELKGSVPYKTQIENWLIDDIKQITKIGIMIFDQILRLRPYDMPKFIFGTRNSGLTVDEVKNLGHSLEMVQVQNLAFDTSVKSDGRNHHRVVFDYNGYRYNLPLTDPKFRVETIDSFVLPKATIIVSIPPVPYGEMELFYKFVARIFYKI